MFDNYRPFLINCLKEDQCNLTFTEFRAAAKLYNIPIIILSDGPPQVAEAFTNEGNQGEPLYILQENNHFDMLLHPLQKIKFKKARPIKFKTKLEIIDEEQENE